ncbi:MAG: proline dehydrogenase family protein [Candidatus Promineifilaceae bacterium]|jgi:proline dehydrogenase
MDLKPSFKNRLIVSFLVLILVGAGLAYWFGETWLRRILLYLSTAVWARNLVSAFPLAKRVSERFVAGETIDDVIRVAQSLNERGMHVTLDYLGESVSTIDEANAARDEILRLLDRINQEKPDATVSVKLSQLGLKLHPDQTYKNIRAIVARAKEYNNRVRIDMEDSSVVDITLDIFRRLREEDKFDNVGIVVQSYLYRTEEDVKELIESGANVRLCKGAYMEPAEVAYPLKKDVDDNYVRLTRMMLDDGARQNGVYLGVATHDEQIIRAAKDYSQAKGIRPDEFEFQMLYGIRRELQDDLVAQGYQVRIYVPYGTAWYPYFVRRLAERPANLWFFLSNLLRQ